MNVVILVTTKDKEEAQRISRALLEKKLIACANILEGVQSFFWWKGKIDNASEALLVIKTKQQLFQDVEAAVKSLHSYDIPEVIALPIVEGSKEYLQWIDDSVKK